MYRNEYEIFKCFNEKLKNEEITLTVITVGGFVLNHYGIRTTHDIDGFYRASTRVNEIIREVGEQFGINTLDETWLNNSVASMNESPPEEICDKLYDFSNLTVLMPPLDYIAGMKLQSARRQDIEDVAAVIRKNNIIDPEELSKRLQKYGMDDIDISLLLESFGQAYGMEWLENYYINHQDKLLQH